MGELILIDRVTNMTSACGVVREVNEGADDVKEVDAAFRAELNNQKPVVVETVLSDKINVDFLKKVEKELLLDSKHVYLYVPAEGEDYTNVVTHGRCTRTYKATQARFRCLSLAAVLSLSGFASLCEAVLTS